MNDEDILLHSCGIFDPKECISGKELADELMKMKSEEEFIEELAQII